MNDPSTTIEVSIRRSDSLSASIEIGGRGDLVQLIEAFQVIASLMGLRFADEGGLPSKAVRWRFDS